MSSIYIVPQNYSAVKMFLTYYYFMFIGAVKYATVNFNKTFLTTLMVE